MDAKTEYVDHETKIIPDLTKADLAFKPCRKLPVVVHAIQIPHTFLTDTLEGEKKLGKAGDYLMIGVKGERYPCAKEIFEETYRWVEE
jgi:hypothetical protein